MVKKFEIEEATIEKIQRAFEEGSLTSRELVLMYMDRIAKYDKDGPKINSVLEINPDALQIAEALDYERKIQGPRGTLHGIPILIKDNIDTGDKMHTSAGSVALAGNYAKEDSHIVKRLRKAGAVLLGKTNLTEFANFMAYDMSNGYSSRGGQVLNPYGKGNFDVGGSSSGSGAAVACSFCAAAIGTETSGSILSPSSSNSVVGIKPTLGLISRSGIIPIAHSQDTAGPMSRTVQDAAIMLNFIAGYDEKDSITYAGEKMRCEDYTVNLVKDGLINARIGIPRDYHTEGFSEEETKIFDETIEILKAQGAIIVDNTDIVTSREINSYGVLMHEFKSDLNAYLKNVDSQVPVHSLKDIIEFNEAHKEIALKYGQGILIEAEKLSGTLTEPEYIKERARDIRLCQSDGIDKTMKEHNLDALLFMSTYGCGIAARAGYPSITVPAGYTANGEPIGITFTARAFEEPTLIKLAYGFEQASKKRVPPVL